MASEHHEVLNKNGIHFRGDVAWKMKMYTAESDLQLVCVYGRIYLTCFRPGNIKQVLNLCSTTVLHIAFSTSVLFFYFVIVKHTLPSLLPRPLSLSFSLLCLLVYKPTSRASRKRGKSMLILVRRFPTTFATPFRVSLRRFLISLSVPTYTTAWEVFLCQCF